MYSYRAAYPVSTCKVTLKNEELWAKFHALETEMIITKSGRRMFPSIQVQISNLDPNAHYCIYIDMVPASKCRYKYAAGSGWTPAGNEDIQSSSGLYVHPESPSTGEQWMSQAISFGRVKLTNTANPPVGHIILSSMHKYQPKIIIVQTSDPRNLAWAPSTSITFPETLFIAVTAYQNEKITKLKIDNNPFAKGFRDNGQSKCKKRKIEEEVIDIISNEDDNLQHKTHVCGSHGCESPQSSRSDSPSTRAEIVPPHPYGYPYHYGLVYPYHHHHQPWTLPYFYQPIFASQRPSNVRINNEQIPKPKKLTDFSIKAITGHS